MPAEIDRIRLRRLDAIAGVFAIFAARFQHIEIESVTDAIAKGTCVVSR